MGKRICCCICPCFSSSDEVEPDIQPSANHGDSGGGDFGRGGFSSETGGGPLVHRDQDSANNNNNSTGGDSTEICSTSSRTVPGSHEAPSAQAYVADGHGGREDSSSSSNVQTVPDAITKIREAAEPENEDVNLVDLIEYISQLLKAIKEPQKRQTGHYIWPTSSRGLSKLQEFMSRGLELTSAVKDIIPSQHSTEVKTVVLSLLKGIGNAHVVTAGLLVVVNILERLEAVSANQDECLSILGQMVRLAEQVKQLKERQRLREGMEKIIREAVELIVEASLTCCKQIDSSRVWRFFITSENEKELEGFEQKLQNMYTHMNSPMLICIYDAVNAIAGRNGRPRKPRERGYPEYAVGLEEPAQEVIKLLECESEKNTWGIVLYGFGGMGKTTLADAVFAQLFIKECKYSMVSLFESITSTPNIVELQKYIVKDLMVGTTPEKEKEVLERIITFSDGQKELRRLLENEMAFIYIDNVLEIDPLEKLLPRDMSNARKLRILITARDTNVRRGCNIETEVYDIKCLSDKASMELLEKEMCTVEQLNRPQLTQLVKVCSGVPKLLSLVARFIRCEGNTEDAFRTVMESQEKWEGQFVLDIDRYLFAYEYLDESLKDPFLDICSFFNGWQWDRVASIVGKPTLDMLEKRALVTRGTNTTAMVHDVILKVGQKSQEGMRQIFTTTKDIEDFLDPKEEKDLQGMKGLWLSGIKIKEPFHIPAAKLGFMHRSLRILSLGDITVNGKCNKIFEKLVFLQAGVGCFDLPFEVSKSKELRYLAYRQQPESLYQASSLQMPESQRQMESIRMRDSLALQLSSILRPLQNLHILRLIGFTVLEKLPGDLGDLNDLHELTLSDVGPIEELPPTISKLKSLRVLKLNRCTSLRKLPEELGGLVNSLHELILSGCNSIEELPISISKLKFLKSIKMDSCTNLSHLPDDFGSLTSLQELNLSRCDRLKNFPSSFKNLSSLTSLNVSGCDSLECLPHDLGSLMSLVELNLSSCQNLRSIPDSFGQLKLKAFSMDISGCRNLTQLPDGFSQLSDIRHLNLERCVHLQKLPDAFGKLASLSVLSLQSCVRLKRLPEGLGQLKSLVELDLTNCRILEELCIDFHSLSSLRILHLNSCERLEKLPQDFHCLQSLEVLYLKHCSKLERLPEGFCQLGSLRVLHLSSCPRLQRLPEGFGQLGLLRVLHLSSCVRLERLPEGFGQLDSLVELNLERCKRLEDLCIGFLCLTSLQDLNLSDCEMLQGKWMDDVVELKTLDKLDVSGSPNLVQRLKEIQKECHQSWRFIVETGQGFFEESNSKIREYGLSKLSSELDNLFTDGGEPFNLSRLPLNTVVFVIFDGNPESSRRLAVVEYAIKHRPINFEMLYIGTRFNNFPREIAQRILAHAAYSSEALLVFGKIISINTSISINNNFSTITSNWPKSYLQMSAKIVEDGKGTKYLSCWEYLSEDKSKELVLRNCRGYLQLKQVEETAESSNINMLRELFASGEKEGTMDNHIFLKDYGVHKVGVDELEGKVILLQYGPFAEIDVLRDVLTDIYDREKETSNLEIISIVISLVGRLRRPRITESEVQGFAAKVPWLVYKYPTTITKATRFFFLSEKQIVEWSGIMVIERNGRILSYKARPLREILERWGLKAYPFTEEKIEELKAEEWNQLNTLPPSIFLLKHLDQVNEIMLSQKMILLCGGAEYPTMTEYMCCIRDALIGQWDSIYLIYIPQLVEDEDSSLAEVSRLGNVSKTTARDVAHVAEMAGMSLLTLSEHNTIRFWTRWFHLRREVEAMDEQRRGVRTLKRIIRSSGIDYGPWMTLTDKDGELIYYTDEEGRIIRHQEP